VDELERHGLEDIRLDGHLRQIDDLHAEFFPEGGEDVLFLGEAAFDEDLMDRLGGGRSLSLLEAVEFGGGKAPLIDKALHQLHLFRLPARRSAGCRQRWPQVGAKFPQAPATGFQGGVAVVGDED